jgi:hypothetical protein
MATISVGAEGLSRQVGGVAGVSGDASAKAGREAAGGIGGKRQPVDEYIASLPAQAAFIGGRTLETLTSLPPMPQPKERAGGIVAGGINTGAVNTADTVNTINTIDTIAAEDTDGAGEADETEDEAAYAENTDSAPPGAELTPDERGVVNDLKARDREVRAHEQAHISAGGAYIRGGASYQYQRGPDNKSYAVGGEVGIDTAPERDDPGATIVKMQTVRAAALAPSDPSAQDRAVAASAARDESVARAELAQERRNEE